MTFEQFRQLASSLPEVAEGAHMDHPDFRIRNKIFATLGHPDGECGMVKLTAQQQAVLVHAHPDIFQPVKGAWGRKGATSVRLKHATDDVVHQAMTMAWRNTAPKTLLKQFEDL